VTFELRSSVKEKKDVKRDQTGITKTRVDQVAARLIGIQAKTIDNHHEKDIIMSLAGSKMQFYAVYLGAI